MEMDAVEEGVFVFGVDGAYGCHRVIDGLATHELREKAREALYRCGRLNGEAKRDEVRRERGTVVDNRAAEARAFASREHEELAPVRRAELDKSCRHDVPIIRREVVFTSEVVVVPVTRYDHDVWPKHVHRCLEVAGGSVDEKLDGNTGWERLE